MERTRITKKRLEKWQMLLIIEIIVLLFLGSAIVLQVNRKDSIIDVSLSDWKSTRYFIYDTDGWYVDETMLVTDDGEKPVRLYGPYIPLDRGTYTISIEYECEYDQLCQIYANDIKNAYINGSAGKFSKNFNKKAYNFMLSEEIDNFEFIVDFNRAGYLRVKSIEIQRNSVWLQVILAVTIFLLLVINIWFFFQGEHKFLLTIGGIILLVSLPLFVKGIHAGHDINFHLMRIEGLADELRRGIFPVRISSLWTDGYGYPVSVFYGDILLYVAAILRMIGFPVVMAYKSYLFLINVGTVIISYICFKRIFNRDEIAMLTTLAYATAGYRIVCLYVRAAVGEYSAMMFLPIIAYAIYGFYTSDSDNWKVYRQYAFILALGMTGVIGSHILTTEMVVVTLTVVCIIFLRRTLKKYVLYGYALAVIESVALNLYFLIPFFDYYNNVEVAVSSTSDNICAIQEQGAYIGQYFFFFKDIFGQSGRGLASRMSLTLGMSLIFVLVIAIAIWLNGRTTKEIRILSVLSVFFLFMASDLFPWNYLGLHYKLGRILSQIQFPWRYLGIAVIFLTMLLGSVCKLFRTDRREYERSFAVIICSCMIMMVFYSSSYSNKARIINYYDMAEVDTSALVGGE